MKNTKFKPALTDKLADYIEASYAKRAWVYDIPIMIIVRLTILYSLYWIHANFILR